MLALDARNQRDEEQTMPAQAKNLPDLPAGVANGLVDDPALRAVKTAAPSVAHVNADMLPDIVLLDLRRLPRIGNDEQLAQCPRTNCDLFLFAGNDRPPACDAPEAARRASDRNWTASREEARSMCFIRRKHNRVGAKAHGLGTESFHDFAPLFGET